METKNAIIKSVKLTNADHNVLSAWLMLDYGGSGQGFGGHALYLPEIFGNHPGQANYAGHFIWRVMEIAGVTEWGNLPGKTIRVRGTHSGIEAIGHIIKDDWFSPRAEFEALKAGLDTITKRAEEISYDRGRDHEAGENADDLKIAILVREKFASGNDIPVTRITIDRSEVEGLI